MMKKLVKDGWHDISPWTKVYTESGEILRVVKCDAPASIYRWDAKLNCMVNCLPMRYDTFRRGLLADRYEIH